MLDLIGMFDIHQVSIQIGQNHLNIFPGNTCHALNGGIDSPLLCSAEKVTGKLRLAKTFPSGKSHAAAGTVIIRAVFLHQLDHFPNSYIPSHGLHTVRGFHGLDLVFLGLRIAAPLAPQHASLQKYDGTDSRTIMDGITLDVKDTSCGI